MMTIKQAARLVTGLLPGFLRERLARYRFGYTGGGSEIPLTRETRPDGAFCVTVQGGPAFVLTSDLEPDFMDHFVNAGEARSEMAGFLDVSRRAGPEALLLDVGSNKGLFSLVHLLIGSRHRALLVEPSPPLCQDSFSLLTRNGVAGRAEIVTAGACATSGPRRIAIDELGFARSAAGEAGAIEVPFFTVDELCASRGIVPAIVKIDVEGAEADVLRGATATLCAHRPVLCLELHLDVLERLGESVGAMLSALSAMGYRFETPSGKALPAWRVSQSMKAMMRVVAR